MDRATDPAEVLAAYDAQIRARLRSPLPGWQVERVGHVIRTTAPADQPFGCFVTWSDLDESTADAAIAAQVDWFGGLGRRFEWKLFAHDQPPDLAERLQAAGFVPEPTEALMVGAVVDVVVACASSPAPANVRFRHASTPGDFAAIGRLNNAIWGGDWSHLAAELQAEQVANPQGIRVHLAEADGDLVCAGWVRFEAGTDFASLWGGGTLPGWRGHGIYRALVRRRAEEAGERGFAWLQVDASDDSRPILQRIGLDVLTTTTPWIWTPGTS
jgi:ribosomal protein S18 acetylase RimI-like enzyme